MNIQTMATVSTCGSCGGGELVTPQAPSIPVFAVDRTTAQIDDALWDRLVSRVEKDAEFRSRVSVGISDTGRRLVAERIVHQAAGFLYLIAQNPGVGFSPSSLVDIGWHNFILYTREYAEWCYKVAGRFIHHAPFDEVGVDYGSGHAQRTAVALRDSGWPVDEELWTSQVVYDCGTCNVGGYDCTSTSDNALGIASTPPNNGNCGGQDCSDACGGPDGLVQHARAALGVPNDGNCGGQDSGDACGGGQDE